MSITRDKLSFSRARRLVGRHAYAAVFAFKCRVGGEFFHVYVKPNGLAVARLGVAVSKRVIAHAVARNYCKRLAREVFRVEQRVLKGMDLIVRPRVWVTPAVAVAARLEIRDLLRRAQCQSRIREAALSR